MFVRLLFLLLLALNIGAAAWLFIAPQPQARAFAPTDSGVAELVLLSERDRGSEASAAELASAPEAAADLRNDTCVSIGPFPTQADMRGALNSLTPLVSRIQYRDAHTTETRGFWVFLPAQPNREKALALAPNQPEVLNYLGYSWADRGEHLPEALQMLTKAFNANPNSGAIVDSLGWAYYRLGQYQRAVQQLERAVMIEPSDPDINNHLGDAYWRVGRRAEAEFQWKAVLTLKPDEATRTRIEAKLNSPLGPDSVGKGPAVAAQ